MTVKSTSKRKKAGRPKKISSRSPRKRRTKEQAILDGVPPHRIYTPQKYTPELQVQICTLIRKGSWLEVAAECCGIQYQTLLRWLRWGMDFIELEEFNIVNHRPDSRHQQYADLVMAIRQALAEGEIRDLDLLNQFAKEHVDALRWKMERRSQYREGSSWAKMEKKEITTINKTPPQAPGIALDQLNLPLEVRKEILKALRQREKEQQIQAVQDKRQALLDAVAMAPVDDVVHVLDAEFTVKPTEDSQHEEQTLSGNESSD